MRVSFLDWQGRPVASAEAAPGQTLLSIGQALGLPLEGTCEGAMACSTCHVIVAPEWFSRLPTASQSEEDMLDLAVGARQTSRLACQIRLEETLDGLVVQLPCDVADARSGD